MDDRTTVEQIMTRDVEVVTPEDSLRSAAEKMRVLNVGALPVCQGNRIVGLITDRDIVVRAIAVGHDPNAARVGDAMSNEIQWVTNTTSVKEAARVMKDKQVRRLLVVDDQTHKLCGIVSLGDVSQESGERLAGEALEGISEPSAPNV